MINKVYSVFLTLLLLLSVLPGLSGCSKRYDPPLYQQVPTSSASQNTPSSPSPEVNAYTSIPEDTLSPTPEADSIIPVVTPTDTPAPNDRDNSGDTKRSIVTQEVFMALTSPDLKGRVIGTDGGRAAQGIISDLYSNLSLEPYHEEFRNPVYFYQAPGTETSKVLDTGKQAPDGYNIVGVISGEDDKECLVLSAHFDGVDHGTAALDNAGGVYALLKTAEKLTHYNKDRKLSRDIVIAAFDGEEPGLIGSSNFVDDIINRYEKAFVINLDCVGIKDSDSYIVTGNQAQFGKFIDSLYDQLAAYDFITVPVDGFYASDHLSFEYQGIPAVTIGESKVDGIAHTVNDVAEKVDINEIERLSEALLNYILEDSDILYDEAP